MTLRVKSVLYPPPMRLPGTPKDQLSPTGGIAIPTGYVFEIVCTACREVVNMVEPDWSLPALKSGKALILCSNCAHAMFYPRGELQRDLTKPEVEALKTHPAFAKIRARQEEILTRQFKLMW